MPGTGSSSKSLEQIRMERLFKPGNSSEIEPHKRQCTAADEGQQQREAGASGPAGGTSAAAAGKKCAQCR